MTATSPHGSGRPETNDLPLGPFEGPDGLVARTTPIDPSGLSGPVDLLAVAGDRGMLFEREGAGLACRGEALRIELPAGWSGRAGGAGWSGGAGGGGDIVGEVLGRISAEDAVTRPGTGPLAIGALPFDAGSPATLVVPALVV
ncbi:MAG: hypothetical protein ACRDZQ_14940, partial [Acidimicrobiales bacterium]